MFQKLAEELNKNSGNNIDFNNKDFIFDLYGKPKFDSINYSKIELNSSLHASNEKIAFIDGGNAEIIREPGLSVQIVRISYCIYKNRERISKNSYDFFVISRIVNGKFDPKIVFDEMSDVNSILPDLNDLKLDTMDDTLRNGNHRASVSRLGGIVRLFSEFLMATKLSSKCDIVVLDGSLVDQVAGHTTYIDILKKSAENNNCNVVGFSKSCDFIATNGHSVLKILEQKAKNDVWSYFLFEKDNIFSYACKLHPKSKRIFRIDMFNKDLSLALIAAYCNDPVFFGYPYGLIDADKMARISNTELEYIQTRIFSKLNFRILGNSHSILDNISF